MVDMLAVLDCAIVKYFVVGFFENLVFETKLDADKSVMIKNAIHARKTFVRRAQTLRYEARRKKSRGKNSTSISIETLCNFWVYEELILEG